MYMNNTNTSMGAMIGLVLLFIIAAGLYWWWHSGRTETLQGTDQPTTSLTSTSHQAEVREIQSLVANFGRQLHMVSLAASTSTRNGAIERHYGPYVSPRLITRWKTQPATALGRDSSTTRPDRIDIESVIRIDENQYAVIGRVIEIAATTTTSATSGLTDGDRMGVVSAYPITFTVDKQPDDTWIITDAARSTGAPSPRPTTATKPRS